MKPIETIKQVLLENRKVIKKESGTGSEIKGKIGLGLHNEGGKFEF
jgi:hypothetical protein